MIKAEIHCHIEGAADPALVMRLAQKYNIDVNDVIHDGRYVWHDFTTFLGTYDKAASVFRQPEDYRLLTYDYFSRLANHGAITFGDSVEQALDRMETLEHVARVALAAHILGGAQPLSPESLRVLKSLHKPRPS